MNNLFSDKRIVVICLALLVALSFGNALFNQFVWDDGYLIVENPYVKNLKYFSNLFSGDLMESTINRHMDSRYYRPLSMFSFMVDYHLWGLKPFFWHAENILIHFVNCVLIYLILLVILDSIPLAALTSFLFAVHPIHVEAVTPIYNRMGIQASLFVLLSFWFFIRSDGLKKSNHVFGALMLLVLGLLSKEEVVVLPILFICYDWFYWSQGKIKNLLERKKIIFYATSFLTVFVFLLIRSVNISRSIPLPFLSAHASFVPTLADNLFLHAATVITLIGLCLQKAIIPFPLSAIYWIEPVRTMGEARIWIYGLLIVGVVWILFRLFRKYRDVGFFMSLFFILLIPYFNLIPIADVYTFHERFLYLPILSFCYVMAIIVLWVSKKLKTLFDSQLLSLVPVAGTIVLLILLTATANYTWRNNLTLWRDAVVRAPYHQAAHLNLAEAYMDKGQYPQAFFELKASLEVPGFKFSDYTYIAKLNLAKIYSEQNELESAQKEIYDALAIARQIQWNPFAAYDRMGILLVKQKRYDEAGMMFEKALELNENFVPSYYNLGVLYYERGQRQKSIDVFRKVLGLDPDFIYATFALGMAYAVEGNKNEAKQMFAKVLQREPAFPMAKEYLDNLSK